MLYRTSFLTKALWLLFFAVIYILPVRATHIVGGELYYRYLGNFSYEITLIVYRDCYNGLPGFDDPGYIAIFYNTPNFPPADTLIIPVLDSIPVPPVITSPCLIPPTDICYKKATYIDTVTLLPSSNGYWLAYQRCCRNITILNLVSPEDRGSTYTAFIPATPIFSQNSNPVFKELPPNFICLDTPFSFDHSATDAEGDSMVYSLCTPLDYFAPFPLSPQPQPAFPPPYLDVLWQPPYDLTNVMGGTPMTINPVTGELTCRPNTIGQFVFGICVEEYRNGIYLSTTRRDYQLNVLPCPDITVAAIQNPILNCENNSVTFSNQSTNAGTYHWDFGLAGNADTSDLVSPTFIFPDTGHYIVQLVAFSPINPDCNDTATSNVYIYPGYKIDFTDLIDPCIPVVMFNDTTLTNIYTTVSRHWSFGDGGTAVIADPTHLYSGSGNFTVTLTGTSDKGCIDTATIILELEYLTATTTSTQPVDCYGECNGSSMVQLQYGIPPFTYQWDDPLGQTQPAAINLCAGNFNVIVTDSIGCADTAHVTIVQPDSLQINSLAFTDYCNHGCVGSAFTNVTGGNNGYIYLWSDPQQQSAPSANLLCEGLYTVQVSDSKGCTIVDSVVVSYIDSLPYVNATADEDTIYQGQSTTLHATQATGYLYAWSPPSTLNSNFIPDPVSTPDETTNYLITVTDSNGCRITDTVTVWVKNILCREPEIFIPNAFTPNNDRQNDLLFVRGNTMEKLYFALYDRWGEKVFETNDQKYGWDGIYKGATVAPGVFVYYIKAVCWDKSEFESKGNITVIR